MRKDIRRAVPSSISTGVKQVTQMFTALKKEKPLPQQSEMGFFTDTSLCIGCKACEIACKQWNQLPASEPEWTGTSYDNTQALGATTWRHVQFIEQIERHTPVVGSTLEQIEPATQTIGLLQLPLFDPSLSVAQDNFDAPAIGQPTGTALPFFSSDRWLMHSDVCKHCVNAPCQEACPREQSSIPSSIPSTCSRTSVMAAATAWSPVPLTSLHGTQREMDELISVRSAMIA